MKEQVVYCPWCKEPVDMTGDFAKANDRIWHTICSANAARMDNGFDAYTEGVRENGRMLRYQYEARASRNRRRS